MTRALKLFLAFDAALLLAACAHAGSVGSALPSTPAADAIRRAADSSQMTASTGERLSALPGMPQFGSLAERLSALPGAPTPLCNAATPGAGTVACQVQSNAGLGGKPAGTPYNQIWGYKPNDLIAAYGLPHTAGPNPAPIPPAPPSPPPPPVPGARPAPPAPPAPPNEAGPPAPPAPPPGPANAGAGRTVAIVDAYDDPNVESDLAVYRAAMGLPPCASANGCFTKVGATGVGNASYSGQPAKGPGAPGGPAAPPGQAKKLDPATLPPANPGWASEIALDTEMVSAICPLCKIVLVEANSANMSDLAAAVDVAASYHPDAISNSFYAPEDPSEHGLEKHWELKGTVVTVSAGDDGFGSTFPASVPNVVAVGGTTLIPDYSPRLWDEAVWSGTGSGCSPYMKKPSWQTDAGCSGRTIADVAVDADPRTGVAMYTSIAAAGSPTGWIVGGGTSVGAPVIAAMYALAGNAASVNAPRLLWQDRSLLNHVALGANGTCPLVYLCAAQGTGYSGPTGNGTPNGLTAL